MMLGAYPSLTLFQYLSPDFPAVDLILVRCSGTTSNRGGRGKRTIVGPLMFLAVLLLVLVSRFYLQSKLDEELWDECNDSSKGNRGKVKDMLDRGADPNGYKVRRT